MLLIVKAPPPPHPARGWPSLPIADCEGVRRRRQRSQPGTCVKGGTAVDFLLCVYVVVLVRESWRAGIEITVL